MNFSLRQKIFLGYIVMITFTLLVGMYAIFSLKELNAITRTIVYNSIAINEKLTRLNDSILAQDLYEKRSLLLQQQEFAVHHVQMLPALVEKELPVFRQIHYSAAKTFWATSTTLAGLKGFTMKSRAPASRASMISDSWPRALHITTRARGSKAMISLSA